MLTTRRGFFKLLAPAAVIATVAPTYFLAPRGGWPGRPDYRRDLMAYVRDYGHSDFFAMAPIKAEGSIVHYAPIRLHDADLAGYVVSSEESLEWLELNFSHRLAPTHAWYLKTDLSHGLKELLK